MQNKLNKIDQRETSDIEETYKRIIQNMNEEDRKGLIDKLMNQQIKINGETDIASSRRLRDLNHINVDELGETRNETLERIIQNTSREQSQQLINKLMNAQAKIKSEHNNTSGNLLRDINNINMPSEAHDGNANLNEMLKMIQSLATKVSQLEQTTQQQGLVIKTLTSKVEKLEIKDLARELIEETKQTTEVDPELEAMAKELMAETQQKSNRYSSFQPAPEKSKSESENFAGFKPGFLNNNLNL